MRTYLILLVALSMVFVGGYLVGHGSASLGYTSSVTSGGYTCTCTSRGAAVLSKEGR